MKLLKEFIKLHVERILQEEEEKIEAGKVSVRGWNFNYFKSKMKSADPEKRKQGVRHAEKYLELIGEGSSRKAFKFPGREVLKVAYSMNPTKWNDEIGIAQNEAEINFLKSGALPEGTVTKIWESSPNNSWLVVEKVEPIKDTEEFKEATGISYKIFKKYLNYYESYEPQLNAIYEPQLNAIEEISKKILKKENLELEEISSSDLEEISSIDKDEKKKGFLLRMFSLVERGADSGDLTYNHFGKSADGTVKLYDYGLTKDIWKKFYRY